MHRDDMLQRLRSRTTPWDILIIGGGATGLGSALDAGARGYDVALLERTDFAAGTSSRSTKLVHGGVRYLRQGNVSLVMEALRERGILRQLAPHLVREVTFVVPSYEWWQSPFYGVGLKMYDLLAGRHGFGHSRHLSRSEVLERIPNIEDDELRGGTIYHDGQFDDARLAIELARTAADREAVLVNHCPVTGLLKTADGMIHGVAARDEETGETFEVTAHVVVNATGPFADDVRRMDDPDAAPIIAPSQGVHLVLDGSFLSGDDAIMVPSTADGRVMFAIPWHDRVVVGTTDTPVDRVDAEPVPRPEEEAFILETAGRYLERRPTAADVLSRFAGIRPLARAGQAEDTAAISREHVILVDPDSGLLTVAGGKWTTYRRMAKDVVTHASMLAGLDARPCTTAELPMHGATESAEAADDWGPLAEYGTEAAAVAAIAEESPRLADRLHPRLEVIGAEIAWACRHEMARTLDDALSRRTRCLVLDARAAVEAAPVTAEIMAEELGRDAAWRAAEIERFTGLATAYLPAE